MASHLDLDASDLQELRQLLTILGRYTNETGLIIQDARILGMRLEWFADASLYTLRGKVR